MKEPGFANTVHLVTGAASGIGSELAWALAARGAHVLLADQDEKRLRQACAELIALGHQAWYVQVDVTSAQDVERMAAWAFSEAGRVDALVNCAGIYPVAAWSEVTVEQWDRVLDTNLRGPFLVTQAVVRRMVEAQIKGQVLNVSSTASRLARPGISCYGASKAGLNQLTRVMAVEFAPHGIRVNAILPGVIGTEKVKGAIRTPAGQRENEAKLARIPLRRLGEPDEVARLALMLLSPAATYCTGGLFTVDGGFSLGLPATEQA